MPTPRTFLGCWRFDVVDDVDAVDVVIDVVGVFGAGPTDPGMANVVPRPALAEYLRADVDQRLPAGCAVFATNPVRIRYGTRQLVVLRQDVLTKMCRNAIHFPHGDDIPSQVPSLIFSSFLGVCVCVCVCVCPSWRFLGCDDDRSIARFLAIAANDVPIQRNLSH